MKGRIVIALAFAAAAACGKESPNGPSEIPGALSITPTTNLLKIKGTESFSASGTYSDGSSRTVMATWASDNPAVATIDAAGRATGVAAGQTTINAEAQGQRATRPLRVVPDYHGQWRGDWAVTGCLDEGDWRGTCAEFPAGSLWALALALTQTGDAVSGTIDFGDDLPGAVTGTIRLEGPLVLSGTYTVTLEGTPVQVTVSDWETVTTDNERMTGRFRATFQAAGLLGSLGLDGDVRIVGKTSSNALTGAQGAARSFRTAIAPILRKR